MKPERILKCIQICTGHLLAVSLLFFVTAFLHFPLLLNSSLILQFDEAIQASEIIRLMKGEAFFFYFDYARYHGILHGILAIPFFWLLGISATAYKLTPVLYYAAYIWTTYLLAKAINKKVALITLILLIIPSLTMSSMATHNWQNSLIIVLGNLILLLYFKVNTSGKSTLWIFTFFFFLGLSIYEYSYAIIYFALIAIMFILSHPFWGDIRSKISFKKIVQHIRGSENKFETCLKIFDCIILLIFVATLFAYVWGGFALDIFKVTIFQIHKFNKAAFEVFVLILLRLIISRKFLLDYQAWCLKFIKKVKPEQRKFIGYGLTGFFIGISPRIISILQGNTSKGGKGFDMNIDPFVLLDHLWLFISVRIPEILGVREPLLKFFIEGDDSFFALLNSIVASSLLAIIFISLYNFSKWKWDSLKKILFLKKIDQDFQLVVILLPVFVILANVLTENGAISIRYVYPFFGMALICFSFFLEKIKNKFVVVFLIILWVSFQGFNNYQFYKNSGMIDGFTPVKKPFYLETAIDFLKTKNTQFVYTDWATAMQARLVVSGTEMVVTSTSPRKWGLLSRDKPDSSENFAIIFNAINTYTDENLYTNVLDGGGDNYKFSKPSEKMIAANAKKIKDNPYQKFFDENRISYKVKQKGPHYIFWNIKADKGQFKKLISLIS